MPCIPEGKDRISTNLYGTEPSLLVGSRAQKVELPKRTPELAQ
jgi:hypothetical protein